MFADAGGRRRVIYSAILGREHRLPVTVTVAVAAKAVVSAAIAVVTTMTIAAVTAKSVVPMAAMVTTAPEVPKTPETAEPTEPTEPATVVCLFNLRWTAFPCKIHCLLFHCFVRDARADLGLSRIGAGREKRNQARRKRGCYTHCVSPGAP